MYLRKRKNKKGSSIQLIDAKTGKIRLQDSKVKSVKGFKDKYGRIEKTTYTISSFSDEKNINKNKVKKGNLRVVTLEIEHTENGRRKIKHVSSEGLRKNQSLDEGKRQAVEKAKNYRLNNPRIKKISVRNIYYSKNKTYKPNYRRYKP
jgi:endonuclease YncB( thermonuclease family)